MKFRQGFLIVITLPLHCFCLFKTSGQDVAIPSQMEKKGRNLCTLYDHLKAVDSFLKPKYEKLVLVIADEVRDANTMAEYLSRNNRVQVLKSTKHRIPRQLLKDVVNILGLLYYNNETSTFIFAYPRNMPNKILAHYLTKKIVDSSEKISVLLTCQRQIMSHTLDRMFQVAASITINFTANIFVPLSVIPFDLNKCRLLTMYTELEKYFLNTFKHYADLPNLELLIKHLHYDSHSFTTKEKLIFHSVANLIAYEKFNRLEHFSCQGIKFPQSPKELFEILEFKAVLNLKNSISYSSISYHSITDENLNCFQEKLFKMESNSLKLSSVEKKTSFTLLCLTEIFSFLDFLESSYKNIAQLQDADKPIEYICKSSENLEIIQQLCFLKHFPNKKLFEQFDHFLKNNFVTKIKWFQKLLTMFKNVNQWNKTEISSESEKLFNDIPKTGQYDEQLMTNAFDIVKSNTVKMEAEFTCSQLTSKSYKLQVKGMFLKIGDIFKNHQCPGKIKFIEIFSLDKIIIDEDLILVGEEMQVNIIAPVWEILLNRTINLDGAPGDNSWIHWKRSANLLGTDDFPGFPGEPGGTFFAIIGIANGGKNLQISTNGGKGGNGESGTYGEIRDNIEFICFGNGGSGGPGGIHGVLEVFSLNNHITEVQLSSNNGTIGDEGEGGYHNVWEALKVMTMREKEPNEICMRQSTVGPLQPKKSIILETFDKSLKRYKKFLLNAMIKYKSRLYANFYIDLANNNKIPNDYDILLLIDELVILEKYYSFETNKTITLLLLKAWNNKFREYFLQKLNEGENRTVHTKVFLSLDTMISRKIQKLENKFYDNSVLLIEPYLEACILDSKKLKDVEILVDMKTITQRYTAEFEEEIKNANELLSGELETYLTNTIGTLNTSIQQLVEEIDQMIKMKKLENEKLKDMKTKMRIKLGLKIYFGILQFVFLALAFINPGFAIVGSALSAGSTVVDTVFLDSNDYSCLLNSEYVSSISSMRSNYQKLRKLKIPKKIPDRTPKNLATIGSDAVATGMDNLSNHNSATNEIDNNVNENLEDIKKLEDYKTMVFEDLMPAIEQMNKQITTKTNQFYNSSLTYLEFEKWHMDDYLSDISKQLEQWTETYNIDSNAVGKIQKAIDATIRLHTLIREMNHKITGAQFLANIAKVPYQETGTNIQDEELKNRVTNLMHIHYANDIIDEYKKWTTAFKQYTFPFVKEYPDITERETSPTVDPPERANIIVEKLKYLLPYLNKRKAEAQFSTTMAKFGGDGPLPPFYTWNSSRHSVDIQEILQGKTVSLFANINHFRNLNAVKFRDINILFTSSNATLNEELRNDLSSFSVKLIHNGDSYYRCNKRVQLFQSGVYNFGIKFFMSRRKRFSDYGKLDYVLSPFATWTISLWDNLGKGDFKLLSKYAGKVDMELVGDGEFLNPDINCSLI